MTSVVDEASVGTPFVSSFLPLILSALVATVRATSFYQLSFSAYNYGRHHDTQNQGPTSQGVGILSG